MGFLHKLVSKPPCPEGGTEHLPNAATVLRLHHRTARVSKRTRVFSFRPRVSTRVCKTEP